jgi:ABC-type nitrate/sulfonate/bicarbonate transport system substrate-binding protein
VGDVPAVFRAGNVDAAIIWEPGFSQLKAVERATVLAMDTDTEIYRRFGTMTGPDVLILAKAWLDADPARARRFLTAYFESLDWVAHHPRQAAEIAVQSYIQQDLALIESNLGKFVWHDAEAQRRVMSDAGIFAQAEFLIDVLHDEMGAIPEKPDFRAWVNLDVLPQ